MTLGDPAPPGRTPAGKRPPREQHAAGSAKHRPTREGAARTQHWCPRQREQRVVVRVLLQTNTTKCRPHTAGKCIFHRREWGNRPSTHMLTGAASAPWCPSPAGAGLLHTKPPPRVDEPCGLFPFGSHCMHADGLTNRHTYGAFMTIRVSRGWGHGDEFGVHTEHTELCSSSPSFAFVCLLLQP